MTDETEQGWQGGGDEEGESDVGKEQDKEKYYQIDKWQRRALALLLTPICDSSDDEDVTALMQDVQKLTGMRWLRY
jgi:hypothetical protein